MLRLVLGVAKDTCSVPPPNTVIWVVLPIPNGAAYSLSKLPCSVAAEPDTRLQVSPPTVKLLRPTGVEAKYSGSCGPGVSVTVTAPAAPVRANQASPVVINNVFRILKIP